MASESSAPIEDPSPEVIMTRIEDIEGIGPACAAKLKEFGRPRVVTH